MERFLVCGRVLGPEHISQQHSTDQNDSVFESGHQVGNQSSKSWKSHHDSGLLLGSFHLFVMQHCADRTGGHL